MFEIEDSEAGFGSPQLVLHIVSFLNFIFKFRRKFTAPGSDNGCSFLG